jgi:hypothetical protein
MSIHDAMFGSLGVPSLMDHFGDCESVTVVLDGTNLITDADAILHPIEGVDEILSDGTEVKKLTMDVDLLVDASEIIGLQKDYTNAVLIANYTDWGIAQIRSITQNMQRLMCIRKVPRARRRSGFFADQ